MEDMLEEHDVDRITRQRAAAEAMLEAIGAYDLERVGTLAAPEARYWRMGHELPLSGEHDLRDAVGRMPALYERLPGGVTSRVIGSTSEGSRVCLEAESTGVMVDGAAYRNQQHVAVRFGEDGKVVEFRDYLDTLKVHEALLGGRVDGPKAAALPARPGLRAIPGLARLALRSLGSLGAHGRLISKASCPVERNRHAALEFVAAIGRRDLAALARLYSRSGTFWQIGEHLNLSGSHTQMATADAVPRIYARLPEGMEFDVHAVTSEANRVAIEATSHAKLRDGGRYENHYHFLFRFDAHGRVLQFKEYWGTLHAYRTLFSGHTVL